MSALQRLARQIRGSRRVRRDQVGQALALVSGVMLILTLGGAILVQSFGEQTPIVQSDLIQHQAYRAVEAGLDEYLYRANVNADYVICNSANDTTGFCPGLNFESWTPVQGTSASSGPPSWFYLNDPSLNYTTGVVSLKVEGAAGYRGDYSYQTATVNLEPLNNFLLDLLWINFNQIDPAVLDPTGTLSCSYYWKVGIEAGCENVDFITGDTLNGNIYVNDSIFTCGNPSFQSVTTADPNEVFVKECGGTPTVSGTQADNGANEPIPNDDSSLSLIAQEEGCLYEGPTTITLNGANMNVTSPGTPTGLPTGALGTSTSNDSLDQAGNTNPCMPTTSGGSVALPTNGVVYVEDCPSTDSSCTYNPLSGDGETGATTTPALDGDAIINGTVSGPLTIGTQNNVVIDGNLCYSSGTTCSSVAGATGGPPTSATDMIGLIATNYVELNHPVSGSSDAATCGSYGAPAAPGCDLSDPVVNAAILALNHSFLVNSWSVGHTLGNLYLNGSISEDWRGPVGTSSGTTAVSGYTKVYSYDSRLRYFAPPYYLSPGTASWGIATFTVTGMCTVSCTAP